MDAATKHTISELSTGSEAGSVRRICLFAGPGSGKSTLAAKIFAELKSKHYDVELVPEWIKTWAHEGRKPVSYDQYFVNANQLHAEDIVLRHVRVIVTDSPVLMNATYSKFYGFKNANLIAQMAMAFETDFPSLNFFLMRTVNYVQSGRYQKLDQAIEFDSFLQAFLSEWLDKPVIPVTVDDFEVMMEIIESNLGHAKLSMMGGCDAS